MRIARWGITMVVLPCLRSSIQPLATAQMLVPPATTPIPATTAALPALQSLPSVFSVTQTALSVHHARLCICTTMQLLSVTMSLAMISTVSYVLSPWPYAKPAKLVINLLTMFAKSTAATESS